jgi:DNA-binding beta-propeller fold protein YncE
MPRVLARCLGPPAALALAGVISHCGPALAAAPEPLYSETVPVGGAGADVESVLFDGKNVWVSVQEIGGGYVRKLSSSGAVLTSTPVGTAPLEMTYDGSRVWVTDYNTSDVTVVDANGNAIKTFQLPANTDPEGIKFDGRYVWVANNGVGSPLSNTVSKYDPATLTLVANYPVGLNPDGVAFDGSYIWVTNSNSNNVMKISRQTGALVRSYPTGLFPLSILFDGRNMWVGDGDDQDAGDIRTGSVTKLRAFGGDNLGTFPVGSAVRGLAFDGSAIWVCNSVDNTFTRLLAADGSRLGTYWAGGAPRAMAYDGTRMWIANSASNTVTVVAASSDVLTDSLAGSRSTRPGAPALFHRGEGLPAGGLKKLEPLDTPVDLAFSALTVTPPGTAAIMGGVITLLVGDN